MDVMFQNKAIELNILNIYVYTIIHHSAVRVASKWPNNCLK